MTDKQVDQDMMLDDDNVVEAHDPKKAEEASIAANASAEEKGPKAKARKGDKSNAQSSELKTKAGMINAGYEALSAMNTEELQVALGKLMGEDTAQADVSESREVDISVDFSADLDALVEAEATLSEEFKAKTALIFEAAVKSKLSEEIDRLEDAYATELAEEVATTKADLVEKVDSYLNYVVESWMEDNKLAVKEGLRTEIAETFMGKLKDLFVESYVQVPDSKVDLVDELALANEELEESYNVAMAKALNLAEELETYKRAAIISEASRDLADTQAAKLTSLLEGIAFDSEDTFKARVATIKESYFAKKTTESAITEEVEDDNSIVEVSGSMAQYVQALRNHTK